MAVTGTSTGIAQGLTLSLTRPGAANATGDLIVIATASIADGAAQPTNAAFTQWYTSSITRFSLYGHNVNVRVAARLGSSSETATYVLAATGATASKTVLSGVCYRVSNPADATTLANNLGAVGYQASTLATVFRWSALTLQSSGSVILDVGSMLALTDPNAASLKLRTGDTEAYRSRLVETDAAAYYLACGHGYREGQSGSLALDTKGVTGNLGANSAVVEVKQASGGGGPPATGGGTGRVIYVGA